MGSTNKQFVCSLAWCVQRCEAVRGASLAISIRAASHWSQLGQYHHGQLDLNLPYIICQRNHLTKIQPDRAPIAIFFSAFFKRMRALFKCLWDGSIRFQKSKAVSPTRRGQIKNNFWKIDRTTNEPFWSGRSHFRGMTACVFQRIKNQTCPHCRDIEINNVGAF